MSQRDLVEVIDQILAVIPESEVSARTRLEKVQNSARYTAPEVMRGRWYDAAKVLESELGSPAGVPWKEQVAAIFSGKQSA